MISGKTPEIVFFPVTTSVACANEQRRARLAHGHDMELRVAGRFPGAYRPGRIPRHTPCTNDRVMCMARGPGTRERIDHSCKEEESMNKDVLEGKWTEMKGKVKEQWGKLTDDDLDKIQGRSEQVLGLLQQRYGYARDKAEAEYKRFTERWADELTASRSRP